MDKDINIKVKVWRQNGPKEKDILRHTPWRKSLKAVLSEMLDILNEKLINEGKEPVVFDHDCAKVFVVCVVSILMDTHTDLTLESLPVSCICAASTTETPLQLSLGVLPDSQLSKI